MARRRLAAPLYLIVEYVKGAYAEFQKVTWPTRLQVVHYTILVLVTILVSAGVLTAFDYGLQQLTNRFLIR